MSESSTARQFAAEDVEAELKRFLEERTKLSWETDTDLFASGAVSSMFAMELVMHVEGAFGITVEGPDLRLDNFRTVTSMTALVLRLAGTGTGE
ncbi:acyl carrier protein [Kitasatospora sp. NPDC008050]|uniref:acyl carrier protein n=1 Tax=Kitasatospora sp. NPDC008050 TaxID=3364021 RepID=UPI0036E1153A